MQSSKATKLRFTLRKQKAKVRIFKDFKWWNEENYEYTRYSKVGKWVIKPESCERKRNQFKVKIKVGGISWWNRLDQQITWRLQRKTPSTRINNQGENRITARSSRTSWCAGKTSRGFNESKPIV